MERSNETTMEQLIGLCKRRGFVFPSSEIYGGMAGIYDYGHYGILLKENIRTAWWRHMVQLRDDVVGLDSAIFMHPRTWLASGHVEGFNDPQVDCRSCNARFRADHILEDFGIQADKAPITFINEQLDILREQKKLVCAHCGKATLTEARVFSMMVKSNLGSPVDTLTEENVAYLRPETCGGIYLEYKNTVDSVHPSMPFGIAQVGKAFRNEIAARQFIFRTREFEQMEMQYFHHPSQTAPLFEEWKKTRFAWYEAYGIPTQKLQFYKHEKLAHYASDAYDIEYNFSSLGGFKEVEGIHARGNWDLSQHAAFSGQVLDYFDEKTGERYVPHIVETSVGLARLFLMFLDNAYTSIPVQNAEGEHTGDYRTVLQIHPALAPIKCAVFPLLKNKPALVEKARELYQQLRQVYMCEFDDNGNIGKRYRRQDEIGTPYCITVDFDTLTDNSVTIRHRDTGQQERIALSDLPQFLASRIHF